MISHDALGLDEDLVDHRVTMVTVHFMDAVLVKLGQRQQHPQGQSLGLFTVAQLHRLDAEEHRARGRKGETGHPNEKAKWTVMAAKRHHCAYLCKKEDKISSSSNLVQNTLQALGFSGKQGPKSAGLQGNTVYLFGAEGPLGYYSLGLTFQSDYRLVDSVDCGTARGIHNCQTLLCKNTTQTIIFGAKSLNVTFCMNDLNSAYTWLDCNKMWRDILHSSLFTPFISFLITNKAINI